MHARHRSIRRRWIPSMAVAMAMPVLWACSAAASETKWVQVRDGTLLATEVHRPVLGKGPWPVLLTRTPYGRKKGLASETWSGYVVVSQDIRFTGDSRKTADTDMMVFFHDGWGEDQDGYDTVKWIAAQEWCNGKIGSYGSSAGGITQNMLAGSAPEALTCQFIGYAPSSQFRHATYPGGAMRATMTRGWLLKNRFSLKGFALMRRHNVYDEFWKGVDSVARAPRVNVPAVHLGGWYDVFCQGTIDGFVARQHNGAKGARGRQFLVMGPWTHGGDSKTTFGQYTFPRNSMLPGGALRSKWMDAMLKGKPGEVARWKAVRYYVMGSFDNPDGPGHQWRWADDWPVAHTDTPLYLAPGGTLVNTPPGSESRVAFTSDPAHPVPTRGGCNLLLARGPYDQRRVEKRADVLTFDTPIFKNPTEITGNVRAEFFVSTDTPDADISVRISDVYPDGRSVLITDHILRLSFREGWERKVWMTPGKVSPASIRLWATSIVLDRGHRLRVAIAGSNFPRFDVNPNTGPEADAKPRVATVTLHCGGGAASRVILPLVGAGKDRDTGGDQAEEF